jgi:hypothetical protein
MKIIGLQIAALALLATAHGAASAEIEADENYVTIAFGATMMQVPVSLAVQLCPGADAEALAEKFAEGADVVCEIPYETYASHDPTAEREPE